MPCRRNFYRTAFQILLVRLHSRYSKKAGWLTVGGSALYLAVWPNKSVEINLESLCGKNSKIDGKWALGGLESERWGDSSPPRDHVSSVFFPLSSKTIPSPMMEHHIPNWQADDQAFTLLECFETSWKSWKKNGKVGNNNIPNPTCKFSLPSVHLWLIFYVFRIPRSTESIRVPQNQSLMRKLAQSCILNTRHPMSWKIVVTSIRWPLSFHCMAMIDFRQL